MDEFNIDSSKKINALIRSSLTTIRKLEYLELLLKEGKNNNEELFEQLCKMLIEELT